jgi:hypothetical protein
MQGLADAFSKLNDAMQNSKRNAVRVTPEVIAIDPKTNTAEVTFVNPGNDFVQTDITVQYAPIATSGSQSVAGGLMADDSAATDSARAANRTETKSDGSLELWIRDLPPVLMLKAHETRKVTMHVVPPSIFACSKCCLPPSPLHKTIAPLRPDHGSTSGKYAFRYLHKGSRMSDTSDK